MAVDIYFRQVFARCSHFVMSYRNKTLQNAQYGLDINFNTNDNNTGAKNYKGRVYANITKVLYYNIS